MTVNIEPIKKIMLHSKAAEVIEKYIHDNHLNNGDRLPSERELANMLSIGRNSLREAIRKLETMNVVEVVNGKGIFVKNIDTSGSINVSITAAKVNILELLDIRAVLETHAIELVIQNAAVDEIQIIEETLLEIEKKYQEGIYPVEEDNDFHNAIYNACHNKTLCELIKPLAGIFDELWEPFGLETEVIMKTLPLHRPLYEAIKNRKTKEAKKIFKEIMALDEKAILDFKINANKGD